MNSIFSQNQWITMIFVMLVWPAHTESTSIKPNQDQSYTKYENSFAEPESEPVFDINEPIYINTTEKKQIQIAPTYSKTVYNRNNNSFQTKNESEFSSKYTNDELPVNPAVGGKQTSNIKFSETNINNNKDVFRLSNYYENTNQIYEVQNDSGLLRSHREEKNVVSKNKTIHESDFGNNNKKPEFGEVFPRENPNSNGGNSNEHVEKREIEDALDYGLKYVENLVEQREPLLYKLGFVLKETHPAHGVANFGRPKNKKNLMISNVGYALLEASRKLAESFPEDVSRSRAGLPESLQSRIEWDQCPFKGSPRCPLASQRFRTSDGICNNLENPWRGAAMLPMQRFLPPVYEDGIQSIRRSVLGAPLPSPRDISTFIHRDRNIEIDSVTLMFTQWGQFIDHDIVSAVKHLSFNGSTPRCCDADGRGFLPPQFLHPACLPIEVPKEDPFLSKFGIKCMEFTRSSPSTRIDCDLGWREQINQVTPYLDASMIYGSDIDTMDSMRTFRKGKIIYGRVSSQGPLNPPDPVDGELCRAGVITEDCMQPGDTRFSEQPGLIAMHTVFVRYHNKIATVLSKLNSHWSDERVFQETRKIVYSAIQHITYREYLPVVLGPQVMDLFELKLQRKGYYEQYEPKVNPAIANAFGAAAFRFGHSMVQNSFVRTDPMHIPLENNVSLHEEESNPQNIWSFGAVDRLMLGFANQPSQRRDEFIAKELTNHLFQFSDSIPFGMDLAAINIQRGRDHGIPPYTFWRLPCGLSPVRNWTDLESIMHPDVVNRLKILYGTVDDVDLFTAGLAEKPLRGGVVGPTFACIIAQQFSNLRRGDRFWYENGGFDSSFTPAQLQQIRKISLSQILCQTMNEIETIQPFVFLSPDNLKNARIVCNGPDIRNFDLGVWAETTSRFKRSPKNSKTKPHSTDNITKTSSKSTTKQPGLNRLNFKVANLTVREQLAETKYNRHSPISNKPKDVTYLLGLVPDKTTPTSQVAPIEVNIKIQYFVPTTTTTTPKTVAFKKKPNTSYFVNTKRPLTYSGSSIVSKRPNIVTNVPTYYYDYDTTTKTPYYITPNYGHFTTNNGYYDQKNPNRPSFYDQQDNNKFDYKPYYRPTDFDSYDDGYDSVVISSSHQHGYGSSQQYNKRPVDTNIYGSNNANDKPQTSYNFYSNNRPNFEQIVTYNKNRRPAVQHNYNRDRVDTDSDVHELFFNNDLTQRPIFGQDNYTVPTKIHVTSTSKHGLTHISDKLDFRSRFINGDIKTESHGSNFVKIGTVYGEIRVPQRNAKDRERHNAAYGVDVVNKASKKHKVEIVDLDLAPSESGNNQWHTYEDTESVDKTRDVMPEFVTNGHFSEEVPTPMFDLSSASLKPVH